MALRLWPIKRLGSVAFRTSALRNLGAMLTQIDSHSLGVSGWQFAEVASDQASTNMECLIKWVWLVDMRNYAITPYRAAS